MASVLDLRAYGKLTIELETRGQKKNLIENKNYILATLLCLLEHDYIFEKIRF